MKTTTTLISLALASLGAACGENEAQVNLSVHHSLASRKTLIHGRSYYDAGCQNYASTVCTSSGGTYGGAYGSQSALIVTYAGMNCELFSGFCEKGREC